MREDLRVRAMRETGGQEAAAAEAHKVSRENRSLRRVR